MSSMYIMQVYSLGGQALRGIHINVCITPKHMSHSTCYMDIINSLRKSNYSLMQETSIIDNG